MQIGLAEWLAKLAKLKTDKEKINALKMNDSLPLRIILSGAFDPAVKWLLPKEDPPYKVNDLVDQERVLIKECEKLRYYIEGFYPGLNQTKRESMFIDMLERVSVEDSILLLAIKNKKLPYKGITLAHVKEAFPGMIQGA